MGDEKTIISPELDELQKAERERIAQEAAAAKAAREAANAKEIEDLQASHAAQIDALSEYNNTQYKNQGQIISDIETMYNSSKEKDETARKREDAFRYISGVGDTLSSLANLVGVAHGASNQQQKYNSHAVVQKAEEARKARKLEMEDLSKRYDEMNARLRDLKAAGSLKEAELSISNAKEMSDLNKSHRTAAEAETKYYANKSESAVEEATRNYFKQQELDIEANKPPRSTPKPKIIKVLGDNGEMLDLDVSNFKNFEADYQRALAAAIKAGASGLTEDELKAYEKAEKLAASDSNNAIKEFFRTHTPRKAIIQRMGINNPRYQ